MNKTTYNINKYITLLYVSERSNMGEKAWWVWK